MQAYLNGSRRPLLHSVKSHFLNNFHVNSKNNWNAPKLSKMYKNFCIDICGMHRECSNAPRILKIHRKHWKWFRVKILNQFSRMVFSLVDLFLDFFFLYFFVRTLFTLIFPLPQICTHSFKFKKRLSISELQELFHSMWWHFHLWYYSTLNSPELVWVVN